MSGRRALLVGSLPGADANEAMSTAMDRLGPDLLALPDGETGERRNWIISMIEALRTHPDLELRKQGDWSDYDKVPRFRIRRGHTLSGRDLDLGITAAARDARPGYERLAAGRGGADPLPFQVGIPGDLDLALFTFGPAGALRHRRPFTDALTDALCDVSVSYGDAVLFQLEIPAEVVLLSRLPGPLRPALAAVLARGVASLAAKAPAGSRFGIHLCLGDMNHRAFGRIGDATTLVTLTNAIARRWPSDRPLQYVHLPLAHADEPPTGDPAFYAPLSGLLLPRGTRVVAGFAHEDQPLDVQRRVLGAIETAVGSTVDISTSCGLGRRDPVSALRALDRVGELLI